MHQPLVSSPADFRWCGGGQGGALAAGITHRSVPIQEEQASPVFRWLSGVLQRNAPLHCGIDPKLGQVISAVLANPGSLFRAELTLFAAQAHGLTEEAESLVCAVEYFHVASLLFDDLPFMDDAFVRRGVICAHLLHGEAVTTLAALALITRAYALTGAAIALAPAGRREPARALVERCLGTAGMLNGQARDLHFKPASGVREILAVALSKTVPLIDFSLGLPAILGGGSRAELRTLRRVAVCWGLFYQGVDDLKDILETSEGSGKSSNQDQRLKRPNIAEKLGLNRTVRYLHRLDHIAQNCINALAATTSKFAFLQTYHRHLTARLEHLHATLP